MTGSIPFSTFVDITTSTIKPAATFGRLNALVATNTNTGERFEEFSTAADVIARYGVGSSQAEYANTFFGYTSKSATKPQKLTFYNWRQVAKPWQLVSGQGVELESIKVNGSLRVTVGDETKDVTADLSGITNFTDAANILNSQIQAAFPAAAFVVNYDTAASAFVFNATTPSNITFEINDVVSSEIYEGDITSTATTIKPSVSITEDGDFKFSAGSMTSTKTPITAAATVKVLVNNNIEVYSREITAGQTFPIDTIAEATKTRGQTTTLAINSIKVDTTGYTFTDAKLSFTEKSVNDLVRLLKLTADLGATTTQYEAAIPLVEAINDICLSNGDYVTISFDSSIIIQPDIHGELHEVMGIINSYPLSRYYLIACMSDDAIQTMKTSGNWTHVQSTESLIATRVVDGKYTYMNAFVQAIIASIDYGAANGALNINFIDAAGYEDDAITTTSLLNQCNEDRVNTVYITGGYGQNITLYGEGHIMGSTFQTMSVALGETYIKAQMQVQGMNVLTGSNLISLRGKQGQGQVLSVFSAILQAATVSGIIVQGVDLTQSEISTIVQLTGIADIADLVATNGWYVQVDEITDEHIANKTIPVTFVYVANTPTNRIQGRSFVIGV